MNKKIYFIFRFIVNGKYLFFTSCKFSVEIIHKDWYSFLSIKLSGKLLLCNWSKGLIVCWSSFYCFLYSLYKFMIILCNTLSPHGRVQAIPADIGKKFKPIPVIDRAIEVDVAPIKTILSTGSNIVFRLL